MEGVSKQLLFPVENTKKKKNIWRRILYEKQDFDDNYVAESFLDRLIRNAHVKTIDYWDVVMDCVAISQQLAIVCVFVIVYLHQVLGLMPVSFLLGMNVVLVLVGICASVILEIFKNFTEVMYFLWRLLLVVTLIIALSPILRSLALSFANDTISVWVVSLFSTHLLFFDYDYVNGKTETERGALSLNAAVFASVMLVSRLHSALDAFSVICFGFILFGLSPIIRRKVKDASDELHVAITGMIVIMSTSLLTAFSKILGLLFLLILAFVTFVSPAWLRWIQKYKKALRGPWDEAVPSTTASSGKTS